MHAVINPSGSVLCNNFLSIALEKYKQPHFKCAISEKQTNIETKDSKQIYQKLTNFFRNKNRYTDGCNSKNCAYTSRNEANGRKSAYWLVRLKNTNWAQKCSLWKILDERTNWTQKGPIGLNTAHWVGLKKPYWTRQGSFGLKKLIELKNTHWTHWTQK